MGEGRGVRGMVGLMGLKQQYAGLWERSTRESECRELGCEQSGGWGWKVEGGLGSQGGCWTNEKGDSWGQSPGTEQEEDY